MYLQLVVAAILALSGLANPASTSQDSPVPPAHVVRQAVVSPSSATLDRTATVAARDGVALKKLDIVVPKVGPSGIVGAPKPHSKTPGAAGVVVADQLVASKRVESKVVEAAGFQTLGVTWPETTSVGALDAQVRTRIGGRWSGWVNLEPSDNAPDAGTPDAVHAVRSGTDPISIGNADAVQLGFAATTNGGPAGLSLALVGSTPKPAPVGAAGKTTNGATPLGSSAAGSSAVGGATIESVAYSTAVVQAAAVQTAAVQVAVAGAPIVISRATWGAPAQTCTPGVASTLVGGVVHHTVDSNGYTSVAAAMQQIRNDANYHISGLGWCDIGYNFIVDKWGNTYEGRANSLTQAVIGAHAGGFNTGTVGVAMLGTYTSVNPSPAMQSAVARIIGWRLGAYGVDPATSMSYHFGGVPGDGSRYHNINVTLPRVTGHRDVWLTACPGDRGYAAVPNIRTQAHASFYAQGYAKRLAEAQPVVKALYADLLLRPVDSGGLQSWSAMLAGGGSQTALVAALTQSREYVQLRVGQAYRGVLGRSPDAAGLAGWSGRILAGTVRVDDVQRQFYSSQEFVSRAGGTNAGFVVNMYHSILGRAATAGEVASWVAKVNQEGRAWVVDQVWFSLEAASARAGDYYKLFLKRAPDAIGRASWARVLLAQGEGAVRIGIAGSAEYRTLAAKRYP
jgi:hypothetical protein